MIRNKVLSVLALTGLLVGLTVAQGPQPPATKTGGSGKTADPKQSDATAEALRNHPDIRVAEAKLRMAEAELAQAKLLVAQRIAIAEAKVQGYKAQVEHGTTILNSLKSIIGASRDEITLQARDVATAKAALIGAEAELAAARGVPFGATARSADDRAIELGIAFLKAQQGEGHDTSIALLAAMFELQSKQVPAGSATEKLRELHDKRIPMNIKRRPFEEVLAEFIKQAGGMSGIAFRFPEWANAATLKNPPMVGPLEGEQTVAGWLQLILDDFNQSLASAPAEHQRKHDIYIREYGLLMTKDNLAPPGALTLNEYVRQLRATKALEKDKPKQ